MLSPQVALELAETLTTIEDFPRFQPAIQATAEDLMNLCRDEYQARWLVTTLRRTWTRWQGTEAMIAVYRENWEPRKIVPPPPNQAIDWEKIRIECEKCGDTGVIHYAGAYSWCTCHQAEALHKELPDWLEFLSRPPSRPAGRNTRAPIAEPQDPMDPTTPLPGPPAAAPPEPAPPAPRCEHCQGTGYTIADFCECTMGRDLRRVYKRGPF
jgi:hypothetical protein